MLAPNYLSADELGLTPSQRDSLIKVLGMLERGELHPVTPSDSKCWNETAFSMSSWAVCICGHAKRYAEWGGDSASQGGPTGSLFYRTSMDMAQATAALRDYLTGHNPRC
jgi:hypothetical protein